MIVFDCRIRLYYNGPHIDVVDDAQVEKLSNHMFAVIWTITEMDISSTIANVCRKVTRDRGQCSEEVLLQRCQALKLLGEYFIARGGSAESGLNDLKEKLKRQQHGGAESKEEAAEATESQQTTATPSAPAASAPAASAPAASAPVPSAQESTDLD